MCATCHCLPDAACSTSDLNEQAGCPSCSASKTSTVNESLPNTGPEFLSATTFEKSLPTPRDGKDVGDLSGMPENCVLPRVIQGLSTLSSADSPASPSAMPVNVKLNLMIGGCGRKWQESFAQYDPDLSLWRTSQDSLLPDSDSSSVTWPKRGMTVNGCAFELPMSALLTAASDCSSSPLLPTPQAFDATGINRSEEARARALTKGGCSNLREIVQLLPTPTTDDASNTTRASGEFLSLARTAHNLSTGEPTSQLSEDGKP